MFICGSYSPGLKRDSESNLHVFVASLQTWPSVFPCLVGVSWVPYAEFIGPGLRNPGLVKGIGRIGLRRRSLEESSHTRYNDKSGNNLRK